MPAQTRDASAVIVPWGTLSEIPCSKERGLCHLFLHLCSVPDTLVEARNKQGHAGPSQCSAGCEGKEKSSPPSTSQHA